MSIIKLPDEGDTYTGTVKSCESVAGQYGQQVKFAFGNGDLLFLPYDSAVRQLMRSGFDDGQDENGEDQVNFAAVVGETLVFARTHNPKKGAKPFWDVSVASGAEKHGTTPSKRIPSPSAKSSTFDDAVPTEDCPPAHHKESGVPESEQGELVAAASEAVQDRDAKREAFIAGYLALYDRTAFHLCALGRAHDFPVDATGINAATATIFINLDKRNLL